jgi:hypothetical protein
MITLRIMNKKFVVAFVLLLFVFPLSSYAHQTRMYQIAGVPYEIVVGSLGEPVLVDDKSGVEVEIVRDGVPLEGAQDALQVELQAGDTSRVVNLAPIYGTEGRYKANFIPTLPTTLTYRVFGTLENVPVDLSFVCNPAGHPAGVAETDAVPISEKVVQTLKQGSFGCPQEKEAFGFPVPAVSMVSLQRSVEEQQSRQQEKQEQPTTLLLYAALLLSVFSVCVALIPYLTKKKI